MSGNARQYHKRPALRERAFCAFYERSDGQTERQEVMPRGVILAKAQSYFCESCGKLVESDHLRQSEFRTHVVIEERRETRRWTNDQRG